MVKRIFAVALSAVGGLAVHGFCGGLEDAKTASDEIVTTARQGKRIDGVTIEKGSLNPQKDGDRIGADEASALKGLADQAYKASDGSEWILRKRDFLTVHTFIAYGDNRDDGGLSITGYRLAKGSDLQGYSIEMPSGAIGKWETSGGVGLRRAGEEAAFRALTPEELDDFHKELKIWLDDAAKSKQN